MNLLSVVLTLILRLSYFEFTEQNDVFLYLIDYNACYKFKG